MLLPQARTVLRFTPEAVSVVMSGALSREPHTPGFSALQLQRQLGWARYETAWTMLQKQRRAMVRPERDRLSGTVELDETYVGGSRKGGAAAGSATARR